jgi:hypothetical protein
VAMSQMRRGRHRLALVWLCCGLSCENSQPAHVFYGKLPSAARVVDECIVRARRQVTVISLWLRRLKLMAELCDAEHLVERITSHIAVGPAQQGKYPDSLGFH